MMYIKTYLTQDIMANVTQQLTASEVIDEALYYIEDKLTHYNPDSRASYYLNEKALLTDPDIKDNVKIDHAREILANNDIYVN